MKHITQLASGLVLRGYLDDLLVEGGGGDGDGGDEDLISGLEEVGALTEVGAAAARDLKKGVPVAQVRQKVKRMMGKLPSPAFARSPRDTQRKGPLGFTEDVTGAKFFTIPAGIGQTTTLRAKVSRAAHGVRLLILPNSPGGVIQSLAVGDEEQALAAGAPLELYGSEAFADQPDDFSPVGPALDMVITLMNTTVAAITGTIGLKAEVQR